MALALGGIGQATAQTQSKPAAAPAQWQPEHQIRLLIPAGPGGGIDTIARLLGPKLTAAFGQSVVPENRPGAGTMIASDMVAKAKPDGYTVVFITGSHTINAAVRPKLPYDPIKDFAPVTQIANMADFLVVNPSLPFKTVKDVVDYAHANPGKLTFGSAGSGSNSHLEGELFKLRTNSDILHVPYKTGVDAVTGIVGGQVNLLFFNAIGIAGQIRADKLRPIAALGNKRMAMFPDVPTMQESGVQNYDTGTWYGVLLPAGTPPNIVARYHDEIIKALQMPDVKKALDTLGADPVGSTPQEFKVFMEKDIAQWKDLVKRQPDLQVNDNK
jgi:tripartite-type tricarboxylate transporter receptor subunit TctC